MFTLLLLTGVGSLVLANEDKHVSGEKGSTISFDCNPRPYRDPSKTKVHFRHQRDEKYFCKHPCGPYNWHSVVANTRRGHSIGSRFSISKIENSDGARVQITQLSDSDAGTWWCGIERPYGDLYQKNLINVLNSQQSKITEVTKVPTSEEEELIEEMAVSGEEDKQKIQSATRALSICNDNHAYALSILQAGSLETKHYVMVCLIVYRSLCPGLLLCKRL
uniref:Immunoglobulin V-set domain-containing protein n=1 Tax=Callorhinchus milii TaxID=7868 RepID=A0A4W3INH6_CALMI